MDVKWGVSLSFSEADSVLFDTVKESVEFMSASNPIINSKKDKRTNTPLHSLESDTTSYVSVIIWWTRVLWIEQKEEDIIHVSVISWRSVEELRCLFVREGWSEYFLWLWRHSCTRTHLEDTHRWDWTYLNVIHSGWESLSRVMWRG